MKKAFPILIVTIVFVCGAMAAAQQSVAEAARQARTQKHAAATIVVEGQSLPPLTSLEPAGSDATKDDSKKTADQGLDAKAGDGKDAPKKSTAEQLKEKADGWNQKIDAQKKEIATLQRELDIVMREQRLRAAAYYQDAGTRLRDPQKFTEDSRKEQEEIDNKKQALSAAQDKLADLIERARKDGVSAE